MADTDLTEATTAALNALIGAVHDPKNCLPDEETCWEQNPVHPCFEQDGRHIALYVHPDGVVKLIVEAVAPLLIEQGRRQALTEAYWKIREHGSSYRAAKVFRRAWERAEANPDDERARHHLAVHEFYARGVEAAADDIGGMLGCEPGEEPPLSCGCPPEHHDEAKRRAADPAERRALLARLTQQSVELGTYDKTAPKEI